ncbi:MAG TPA: FG-GAP-like repeat-containing protein [Candidatus Limnocylindrales bacterium]|nr:FG-GAP-like repeat-containing protein [Candidatus Limnocylindrales bacterium]
MRHRSFSCGFCRDLLAGLLLWGTTAWSLSTVTAIAQQFTEIITGLPNYPQTCVAWADYDGDGRPDVLVAGLGKRDTPTTTLFRNTITGFVDSGIILPGLSRASAAWGDFDNDGRLDLAMTGLNGSGLPVTVVFRNNVTNFTAVPSVFFGVFAGNLAWGDYDGDGRLDLLVTGVTSASTNGVAVTRLYHNDGSGVFSSVQHPFPDCYLGAVAWGDYNNDGKLDVLIAGTTANGGLVAAIWRNDGGGTFTDIGANLPGMDIGFAAWGDYDNDGDLDLLFGGNTNDGWIARIYRNDGGTFTNINAGLLGVIWSSGAWGDFDNDGDLDVMVIGYDAVAQVPVSRLYRNDAGTFVDSGQTFHNLYLGTLSWVDYNNDGNLDLLIAGNNGAGQELINLYQNHTALTNTVPAAPTALTVTTFGPTATFSWNAATDSQSPSAGLSYNLRVSTTPGGSDVLSPQAGTNGWRLLTAIGNTGLRRSAQLNGLRPGTNYFWSVQAVDTAWAGGPFAAEGTFSLPTPAPPQLVSVRQVTNGFRLMASGTPGWTYGIMAGNDLTTNPSVWPRIGTAPADGSGHIVFTDTNVGLAQRFYRGVYP